MFMLALKKTASNLSMIVNSDLKLRLHLSKRETVHALGYRHFKKECFGKLFFLARARFSLAQSFYLPFPHLLQPLKPCFILFLEPCE